MNSKNADHYFLRGGGEIGELIRAKDWAKTSLGDPADWPGSLRTMVAVMLDNPFGMYIAWGSEYTQIYNDGYRPILGATKHPQALGISTRETFSEIWHIIGHMFDDVMNGNATSFPDFMLPLNINGFEEEECYFDFACNPIRKDNGEVGGVLVTAIETTNNKKARNQLKEREFYIKGVPQWEGGKFSGVIGTGTNTDEQKFILSELQFRTALLESHHEANFDGILLVDTKGKILSYNHRFVEIWNMPQHIALDKDDEKALAFALTQLVNPEKFLERVRWMYENPTEISVDELEFKDGKIIERNGYHVAGADGKYYGCSWTFRDITEQRNNERAVKESEERFRSLAQTLPQLVWITDAQGNQEFASPRWKEYSGIELDGKKAWQEIVHPEDYENINAAWSRSLTTGDTYISNVRLKSKLGEYRWHIVKGEPVLDSENKIVKWVGSFTDIHEHKRAEDQFRQMAERMPQKVWTADAMGNRDYFNQTMLDYSGLAFEELKDWGWKKIIHPEDWPHTKHKWEHSITTGEDFENETRLLRKDGKYLWHLVRATAVKDQNGKPKMWIGSKTEIQEQVELSETLGENLKRSNERMQTILQHAPDAVISIDEDGIIKSWNYEAELIFGWKEHEVIEKTLTETIIPKRYHEGHDTGMKHFLRTGEGPVINKPVELTALKKNGSEFPIELKISTSKINDRYIFIGFIRDISIRKAAEETIQNKTNQLVEAQQLAHIGSWEWDVQTNKINWSDELYRIFGLTPQEFEADYENFLNHIHADDREYVNAIVQQALIDHQPYEFFHKVIWPDGKVRILSATGKVFTDGDGNVIRMSGTAQDVTEQKNYEEELKISEERFFRIFDRNPVPMSLSEIKTNKIKYANHLFYQSFGYNQEEVIGRTSEELNLLDPEEYKRVIDLIFGYLQESRSVAEVQALSKEEREELLVKLNQSEKMKDFEILYTRKNGEKFPVIVSYEVIRIGTESFTVTSYQDITLRKKAEEKLRSQNVQLEKMNKELESFAYISSHDLQEPLRKIQTFITRILEKEENNLSDSGKNMFNRMHKAAHRMQTLIQDLLAYSRTNTSKRKLETTDLNLIIAEIKDDLKEEIKEKNATLEVSQLCVADVIPFQFRQLMINLISNSLKFSNPENLPHIKIKCEIAKGIKFSHVKLPPQSKYCHITVSDNGIGFKQEYSEKIFEIFQRLHGREEYTGTGIGLSIVKKIVDNHNGIIVATGELNKGATFDIYFPTT